MAEPELTHLDAAGTARMVDVGAKEVTSRRAVARAEVRMSPETAARVARGDAPKGDVSVDVQAGVAYLRGEVADHYWIDRLGASARKVDGITGVKNLLHAPGTPAPAAEPRFLASEQFRS